LYWKVQQNSSEKINFVILRNLLNLKIFWRQNLPESKWPPVKQLYVLSCGGREETRENSSETLNFADNAVTEGLNFFSLSVQCFKKIHVSSRKYWTVFDKALSSISINYFNISFFRPSPTENVETSKKVKNHSSFCQCFCFEQTPSKKVNKISKWRKNMS
jgi:hypothetical protein